MSSGTWRQDLLDEAAEGRGAGQVGAVGGDVDAGQHDLGISLFDEGADLAHDLAGRDRAGGPAPDRDDAEGAAVVAAVLDLHIGAGARAEAVDHVVGGFGGAYECR